MVPRYGKDQSVAAIAAPEWTGCSPGWFALILISLISQWPRLLRGPAAFPPISRQGEKNGALNPSGREYSSLVCSQISQNLEESGGCELGQRDFGWGRFLAMSKKIWFKKFTRRSGEKLSCLTFWSETMEPFRVRKYEQRREAAFLRLSKEKQRCSECARVHYHPRGANVNTAAEDVVQIWTLALSFGLQAPLVMGRIFTPQKRRSKLLCFFFLFFSPTTHNSLKPCSSDYFRTIALSWQVPRRRRCPSKKEQTGWRCGSKSKTKSIFFFLSLNCSEPNVWVTEQYFQQRVSQ